MGQARRFNQEKIKAAKIINFDQARKKKNESNESVSEEEEDVGQVNYYSELIKNRLEQRKKKSGRIGTKKARAAVSESSDTLFIMLFMAAGALDLLNMLDMGTFSTAVNWVGSIIYYISLAISMFFSATSSRWSVKARMRKGMWKKIIIPLIELIPGLSMLPAWSGLVLWSYLDARSSGMARPKEKIADGYADDYYIDAEYQEAA